MGQSKGEPERTVLGYSLIDRLVILLGFPLAGAVVGLVLPPLARALLHLPVMPMRVVARFLGSLDEPWQMAALAAGGLVLGGGVAVVAFAEGMKVTLTGERAAFTVGDRDTAVDRADVSAVFLDGKRLVILDRESRQLVRAEPQASRRVIAEAFRVHGYPWQDADPHEDLFQRWTPFTPDLPSEVNSVLDARRTALKSKAGDEARDLGETAAKLGVVVRDEGGGQYWRPLVPPPE